ncbi:MAG: CehA/McbA family metallohydrolase [archaeon]
MRKQFFVVILLFLVLFSMVSAYVDKDMIEENDSGVIRPLYVEETAQREFIVDVPHRIESGELVPVLFEVRDAYGSDYWEYSFYAVEIYDGNNKSRLVKSFSCTDLGLSIDSGSYCTINTRVWYDVEYLNPDLFKKDGNNSIKITAKYKGVGFPDGDAEPDNEFYPLVVQIDSDLPKIPNWYCGDSHYHSSYTDTKFLSSSAGEFGAPISATVSVLDVLGLDWVTVTDHSNSFSEHKDDDIGLSWGDFKNDCSSYDKCLVGTEVNCDYNLVGGGNHLLAYDYSDYIEDNFVDVLSSKNPSCEEVINNVNGQGGFSYAAHPESNIDIILGLETVDTWHDYSLPFSGLQIWNGDIKDEQVVVDLKEGIEKWKDVLLDGRKVFISAGSDAHGDFQNFGKEYTCCYSPYTVGDSEFKESIFEALKNGNCYVSNGDFLIIKFDNLHGDVAGFGEEINILEGGEVEMVANVFIHGYCNFSFYEGIIDAGVERRVYSDMLDNPGYYYNSTGTFSEVGLEIDAGKKYYRFDCVSKDGKRRFYTNPIWVNPIECFDDGDCGESLSTRSCKEGTFCESNVSHFCVNGGTDESYCDSKNVDNCEECRFGCDDAGDVCAGGGLCVVSSPTDDDVFSARNIPFEVVGSKSLGLIEYIDYSASSPRWVRLCRNCDGYFGSRFFSEGEHDVFVRCSDSVEKEEHSLNFFVDSIKPVILKVEPSGGFSDGDFSVRFREVNPSGVFLNYDGFVEEVEGCVEVGRNWECDVSVDLPDGLVEYWFVVEDVAGNGVESVKSEVVVDRTAPVVNNPGSFWKEAGRWYARYIDFDISVTEKNFDEVVVSYDYRGRSRESRLCGGLKNGVCKGRFRIAGGYDDVKIVVRDLAGNSADYVLEGL